MRAFISPRNFTTALLLVIALHLVASRSVQDEPDHQAPITETQGKSTIDSVQVKGEGIRRFDADVEEPHGKADDVVVKVITVQDQVEALDDAQDKKSVKRTLDDQPAADSKAPEIVQHIPELIPVKVEHAELNLARKSLVEPVDDEDDSRSGRSSDAQDILQPQLSKVQLWKEQALLLQSQLKNQTAFELLTGQEILPDIPTFTEDQLLEFLKKISSQKMAAVTKGFFVESMNTSMLNANQLEILKCAEGLLAERQRQSFSENMFECLRGFSILNCMRIFVWPIIVDNVPEAISQSFPTFPIEITLSDWLPGNRETPKNTRAAGGVHQQRLITPELVVANILRDALDSNLHDDSRATYIDAQNETLSQLLTSGQIDILKMAEKFLPDSARQEYSNSMFSCVRRFEYFSCIKYFAWPMIKQHFPALPEFPDYQSWYPSAISVYPGYPIVPFPSSEDSDGRLPEVIESDAMRNRSPRPETLIVNILRNTLEQQPRQPSAPSALPAAEEMDFLTPEQLEAIKMAEQLFPSEQRAEFVAKTMKCIQEYGYLTCTKYLTWPSIKHHRPDFPKFPDISHWFGTFAIPELPDLSAFVVPSTTSLPLLGWIPGLGGASGGSSSSASHGGAAGGGSGGGIHESVNIGGGLGGGGGGASGGSSSGSSGQGGSGGSGSSITIPIPAIPTIPIPIFPGQGGSGGQVSGGGSNAGGSWGGSTGSGSNAGGAGISTGGSWGGQGGGGSGGGNGQIGGGGSGSGGSQGGINTGGSWGGQGGSNGQIGGGGSGSGGNQGGINTGGSWGGQGGSNGQIGGGGSGSGGNQGGINTGGSWGGQGGSNGQVGGGGTGSGGSQGGISTGGSWGGSQGGSSGSGQLGGGGSSSGGGQGGGNTIIIIPSGGGGGSTSGQGSGTWSGQGSTGQNNWGGNQGSNGPTGPTTGSIGGSVGGNWGTNQGSNGPTTGGSGGTVGGNWGPSPGTNGPTTGGSGGNVGGNWGPSQGGNGPTTGGTGTVGGNWGPTQPGQNNWGSGGNVGGNWGPNQGNNGPTTGGTGTVGGNWGPTQPGQNNWGPGNTGVNTGGSTSGTGSSSGGGSGGGNTIIIIPGGSGGSSGNSGGSGSTNVGIGGQTPSTGNSPNQGSGSWSGNQGASINQPTGPINQPANQPSNQQPSNQPTNQQPSGSSSGNKPGGITIIIPTDGSSSGGSSSGGSPSTGGNWGGNTGAPISGGGSSGGQISTGGQPSTAGNINQSPTSPGSSSGSPDHSGGGGVTIIIPTHIHGQSPSSGGQAPSTSGQIPSSGGQVPSTGGQFPSTGGQVSTGGQFPSSGGQVPSSGGQFPSSGGQFPSTGGQFPSSGGQFPSSGGQVSTGGQFPSSGGQFPSSGGQFPSSGGQVSTGGQFPSSGGQVPSSGGQFPSSGGQVSSGGQFPSSGGQVPSSGGQFPSSGGQVSTGGQFPSSGGQFPSSGGQVSSGGQFPSSGGQVPSSGGQVPSTGGQFPSSGGQIPSTSGQVPSSGGSISAGTPSTGVDSPTPEIPSSGNQGSVPSQGSPSTPDNEDLCPCAPKIATKESSQFLKALEPYIIDILYNLRYSMLHTHTRTTFIPDKQSTPFARLSNEELTIMGLASSVVPSPARRDLYSRTYGCLQASVEFMPCTRDVIWPYLNLFIKNLPEFPKERLRVPPAMLGRHAEHYIQSIPEEHTPFARISHPFVSQPIHYGQPNFFGHPNLQIASRSPLSSGISAKADDQPIIISVTDNRFGPIYSDHPESMILNIINSITKSIQQPDQPEIQSKVPEFLALMNSSLNQQQESIIRLTESLLPEPNRQSLFDSMQECMTAHKDFVLCSRDVIWPILSESYPRIPNFPNFQRLKDDNLASENLQPLSEDSAPISETDVKTGQHGDAVVTITDTRFVPIYNEHPEEVILKLLKVVQNSSTLKNSPSSSIAKSSFEGSFSNQQTEILAVAENLLPESVREVFVKQVKDCAKDNTFLECTRDITWPTLGQFYPRLSSFPNVAAAPTLAEEKPQQATLLPPNPVISLSDYPRLVIQEQNHLQPGLNIESKLENLLRQQPFPSQPGVSYLNLQDPLMGALVNDKQAKVIRIVEESIPETARPLFIAKTMDCLRGNSFALCAQVVAWPTLRQFQPALPAFPDFANYVPEFPGLPEVPNYAEYAPAAADFAPLGQYQLPGYSQPLKPIQEYTFGQHGPLLPGITPSVESSSVVPGYAGQPTEIFLDISQERVEIPTKSRQKRSIESTDHLSNDLEPSLNVTEAEILELLNNVTKLQPQEATDRPGESFVDTLNATMKQSLTADQLAILQAVEKLGIQNARGIMGQVIQCVTSLSFLRCLGIFIWPMMTSIVPTIIGLPFGRSHKVHNAYGKSFLDMEHDFLENKDSVERAMLDWYKHLTEEKFSANYKWLRFQGYGDGSVGVSFIRLREARAKIKDHKNLPSILTIISDIMEDVLEPRPDPSKNKKDKKGRNVSYQTLEEDAPGLDDQVVDMVLKKMKANASADAAETRYLTVDDAYRAFEVLFGTKLRARTYLEEVGSADSVPRKHELILQLPRVNDNVEIAKKITSSLKDLARRMKNNMPQIMPGVGFLVTFVLQSALAHARAAASIAEVISNMAMGSAVFTLVRQTFFAPSPQPIVKHIYAGDEGMGWNQP